MSYEIVYAREFIKLSDGRIIPMILCGSNNCYETGRSGRERRSREWYPFFFGANINPAFTVAELMQRVYSFVPSTYGEHFMRNGKYVDDDGFVRFFGNGIKNAKTFEEIRSEALWMPQLIGVIKGIDSSDETKVILRKDLCSTYEIETFLSDFDRTVRMNKSKERIYAELEFSYNNPIRRNIANRKPRLDKFYAVMYNETYIVKLRKYNLYHSLKVSDAMQFKTEKAANKWIEQRELKKKYPSAEFKVKYVT